MRLLILTLMLLGTMACSKESDPITAPAPTPTKRDYPKPATPMKFETSTEQTPAPNDPVKAVGIKVEAKVEGNDLITSNPSYDEVPLTFNKGCVGEVDGVKLKLKKGSWQSTSADTYTADVYQGSQTIETPLGPLTLRDQVEVQDLKVDMLGIKMKRLTKAVLGAQELTLEPKLNMEAKYIKDFKPALPVKILGGELTMNTVEQALFSWTAGFELRLAQESTIRLSNQVEYYPRDDMNLGGDLKLKLTCRVIGRPVPTKSRFYNQLLAGTIKGDQWYRAKSVNFRLRDGSPIAFEIDGRDLRPMQIEVATFSEPNIPKRSLAIPAGTYTYNKATNFYLSAGELKLTAPYIADFGESEIYPEGVKFKELTFSKFANDRLSISAGRLSEPAKIVFEHASPILAGPNVEFTNDGYLFDLPGKQTVSIEYGKLRENYARDGEPPAYSATWNPYSRGTFSVLGAIWTRVVPVDAVFITEYNPEHLWHSKKIDAWRNLPSASIAKKAKYCIVTLQTSSVAESGTGFTSYGAVGTSKTAQSQADAAKNCSNNLEQLTKKLRQDVRTINW